MAKSRLETPWDRVSVVSGLFHSTSILPEFFENMANARHIILADGASTDDTVVTVHRLRPDTTVPTNETDPGAPSIYNQCLRSAKTLCLLTTLNIAKLSSTGSPSSTMQIFSSANSCLRVA